jgi:hypothetical protein
MKRNKLFFFLHGNRQNEFETFVGQQHSVTIASCDDDTLLDFTQGWLREGYKFNKCGYFWIIGGTTLIQMTLN